MDFNSYARVAVKRHDGNRYDSYTKSSRTSGSSEDVVSACDSPNREKERDTGSLPCEAAVDRRLPVSDDNFTKEDPSLTSKREGVDQRPPVRIVSKVSGSTRENASGNRKEHEELLETQGRLLNQTREREEEETRLRLEMEQQRLSQMSIAVGREWSTTLVTTVRPLRSFHALDAPGEGNWRYTKPRVKDTESACCVIL